MVLPLSVLQMRSYGRANEYYDQGLMEFDAELFGITY